MLGGLRSLYGDVKQDSWLLQTLKQKLTTYSKPDIWNLGWPNLDLLKHDSIFQLLGPCHIFPNNV